MGKLVLYRGFVGDEDEFKRLKFEEDLGDLEQLADYREEDLVDDGLWTTIAEKDTWDSDGSKVVLGVRKLKQVQYATWLMDRDGNRFWGHYYEKYDDAVRDFLRRD